MTHGIDQHAELKSASLKFGTIALKVDVMRGLIEIF
jgi:hypothetical protein